MLLNRSPSLPIKVSRSFKTLYVRSTSSVTRASVCSAGRHFKSSSPASPAYRMARAVTALSFALFHDRGVCSAACAVLLKGELVFLHAPCLKAPRSDMGLEERAMEVTKPASYALCLFPAYDDFKQPLRRSRDVARCRF